MFGWSRVDREQIDALSNNKVGVCGRQGSDSEKETQAGRLEDKGRGLRRGRVGWMCACIGAKRVAAMICKAGVNRVMAWGASDGTV